MTAGRIFVIINRPLLAAPERCDPLAEHSSPARRVRSRSRPPRLRRQHRLLDLAEPLLAEEHLLADEEGRDAEDAALGRGGGVVGELLPRRSPRAWT